MADAKKCDICGNFYLEKDKVNLVNHPKFGLKDRTINWINVYDRRDNIVGTFDLCDDCAKKLYHFLCNEPEPGNAIRDNLLVTMGCRAGYMDDRGDIELPIGSSGEDELAEFAVDIVDKYRNCERDISFDVYIEAALRGKFGKE